MFLIVTSDGITYSSPSEIYPDVENFQVLGYGEGVSEEQAFDNFIDQNKWILDTEFKEVICIEIKSKISQGKIFTLRD